MILIFDTNSGLCNQMYDIINGINFCLLYNIHFTFRNCSFRNDNLTSWTKTPFEQLFDLSFLDKYKLYINYYNIKDDITYNNCFNLNTNILAPIYFNKNNILEQFINLNKKYIVLVQFWSLYEFKNLIDDSIYKNILPSKNLMDKYIEIKNELIKEPYNFIHYRYEIDFTNYFKIKIDTLDNLIENIKFKNNNLKIYIATSHIEKVLDIKNNKYNILYKNDISLSYLNFEELAFIDYMFGLNSEECYGHNKSSFSVMINNHKNTNNYYNV